MNNICISKLIVPGTLVGFRLCNQPSWSLNIVSKCSEDYINLPLTTDLMKACLFIDTKVDIKYQNKFYEYIITGSVVKIELSAAPFITIKIDNVVENHNNRAFPRLDVYLPSTLSCSTNSYFCTVTNLSLGGIAFLLDRDIDMSMEYEINMLLEDRESVFAKGTILRKSIKNTLNKYGMMFTFMDEENNNHLYAYLHSLNDSYNTLRSMYL